MCDTTISGIPDGRDWDVELTERGKEILAIEVANFKDLPCLSFELEGKRPRSLFSIVKQWIGGIVL